MSERNSVGASCAERKTLNTGLSLAFCCTASTIDRATSSARVTSGGVKITINKGSDQGIERGWSGYIVDKATKHQLSGSSFTVSGVKPNEAEATVKLSLTAVQNNRAVVVKPPK